MYQLQEEVKQYITVTKMLSQPQKTVRKMQKVVHFPKTKVTPSEVSFFPNQQSKTQICYFHNNIKLRKAGKAVNGDFFKRTDKQELIFSKLSQIIIFLFN